jgi:hypothetical protein
LRRLLGERNALNIRANNIFHTMPFTVTHQLGRPLTFPELQELARHNEVQINGNELAGDFWPPDREQPKVKGKIQQRPASFSFGIPPLTGRNSPLKSRNLSLIHYVSAGF